MDIFVVLFTIKMCRKLLNRFPQEIVRDNKLLRITTVTWRKKKQKTFYMKYKFVTINSIECIIV